MLLLLRHRRVAVAAVEMVSRPGICAKRVVVVDPCHHMLGQLVSIVSKELLNGQRVVVVQCKEICLSGGMIPHKTKRGAAALAKLKAYEGVSPPYDRVKRMVILDALGC